MGVRVRLDQLDGTEWIPVGEDVTNDDGRIDRLDALFDTADLPTGTHRLVFDTGAYFGDQPTFYPEVVVTFQVTDSAQHYHVPLLLSPFAYSTYRGS